MLILVFNINEEVPFKIDQIKHNINISYLAHIILKIRRRIIYTTLLLLRFFSTNFYLFFCLFFFNKGRFLLPLNPLQYTHRNKCIRCDIKHLYSITLKKSFSGLTLNIFMVKQIKSIVIRCKESNAFTKFNLCIVNYTPNVLNMRKDIKKLIISMLHHC